jgi:beta-N-acetylhexosaminidase
MTQTQAQQESLGIHLLVGFNGTTFGGELKSLVEELHIGGVVLFKRNVQSLEQLQALVDEAQAFAMEKLGRPLLFAVDQEGGPVQRLAPPFERLPSAQDLALGGPDILARWAAIAARELSSLGVQVNLAPVLEVLPSGNGHFMESRALGSDPEQVSRLGNLWIQTLQTNGVSATAKHFPGLGLSELDPHHYAPVIRWPDESAMDRDLLPFRRAIGEGVHCVMTSHALYPGLDPVWPATLSPVVSRDLLRGKLGFEGALLSDDLDMAAVSEKFSWEEVARQGLLASIDFFLLCQHSRNIEPFFRALQDCVRNDRVLAECSARSSGRIRRLFALHQSFQGAGRVANQK